MRLTEHQQCDEHQGPGTESQNRALGQMPPGTQRHSLQSFTNSEENGDKSLPGLPLIEKRQVWPRSTECMVFYSLITCSTGNAKR